MPCPRLLHQLLEDDGHIRHTRLRILSSSNVAPQHLEKLRRAGVPGVRLFNPPPFSVVDLEQGYVGTAEG